MYVQLSRIELSTTQPSKVDLTSAYQISSIIVQEVKNQQESKEDLVIESDKQSESSSAIVTNEASKDNTNDSSADQSKQNSDTPNNINISPVFPASVIKPEVDARDNTNSVIVNSDENKSSENTSNNAEEDDNDGYVIIGESVSSSSRFNLNQIMLKKKLWVNKFEFEYDKLVAIILISYNILITCSKGVTMDHFFL